MPIGSSSSVTGNLVVVQQLSGIEVKGFDALFAL